MASLHVAPVLAANDKPHKDWAYAEALRDVVLGVAFCDAEPNLSHIGSGEFRAPILGASRLPALGNHVGTILGIGSKEEMCGVDAGRMVASVAHTEAIRDIPAKQEERRAMSPVKLVPNMECAIAARESTCGPYPAAVANGHFRHESLMDRSAGKLDSSHVSLPQGSLVRLGGSVHTATLSRSNYTLQAKEA